MEVVFGCELGCSRDFHTVLAQTSETRGLRQPPRIRVAMMNTARDNTGRRPRSLAGIAPVAVITAAALVRGVSACGFPNRRGAANAIGDSIIAHNVWSPIGSHGHTPAHRHRWRAVFRGRHDRRSTHCPRRASGSVWHGPCRSRAVFVRWRARDMVQQTSRNGLHPPGANRWLKQPDALASERAKFVPLQSDWQTSPLKCPRPSAPN